MSLNDLGAVPASTTIYLFWTSHDGATGANEAASNLAVGDILIYKNGSTTQRSSTSGFTLLDTDGIDFDGLTGVNGVSIDLSDNTDAGFYAVGSWYTVILGPITIDTQTVYLNLASFRIVAAEAITGKPKVDVDGWLGTAAATPSVNGVPEVDITHIAGSAVSATTAQLGVNVVQVSGDSVAADNLEAEFDGTGYKDYTRRSTAQGGAAGSITLDASASATDDLYNDQQVSIISGTGAGQARLITDYVGATKVASISPNWVTNPDNTSVFIIHPMARMVVGVIQTNAVNAAALAADAVTEIQSGLSTLDAAGIRTAVGLASANLDTQLDALPTAAENADAVWDEDATAHQTGGTFGQAIGDPGADTNTIFKAVVTDASGATVGVDSTAILADTDEIQQELADGGRTDLLVDAIKAKTDSLTFTVAGQVDANAITVDEDEILDDQLADSVPSDGTLPTVRQALYMIWQFLSERSVSGTTLTVKKADGSTSLMTFSLDDGTNPSSISRAT